MVKEHLRERGIFYLLGYAIFLAWVGIGAFVESDSIGEWLGFVALFAVIGAVAGAIGLALYLFVISRSGSGTSE
jgi:RsiW-degrading membrane proteinase PrsW (M82 family)